MKIDRLKEKAKKLRKDTFLAFVKKGEAHLGGSFSMIEIILTLYEIFLKKNDKFILSKGHAGILQYVILNYKKIITDKSLHQYSKKNGILGVHPDYGTPGIEASTGSLGHGLAIAAGMAFANRKKNIFIVLSDGELQEGSIWEATLLISSLNLKNITIIVDSNGYQSSTRTKDTHPTLYPIGKKFKYFGWDVSECNGHSAADIFKKLKNKSKKKPFALIANTKKGFPVSFMMKDAKWHYRSPNKNEFNKAIKEINKK